MKLFEFHNFEPQITEEALLIPAFKIIHDTYKESANDYFTYLFFMIDFRSDFEDIVDENEREVMVLSNVLPGKTIEKGALIDNATALYKKMQNTASMRLVHSARRAMYKIETFLNDVDLNLMDQNGKPIYSVKMIADVVGGLSKMTTALNELEATVKREMDQGSRIRGGGQKSFYED